jgi:acetolactate synthase I/III small subunit
MKRPTTICALTENRPGVLARIAGLFSRRAFNLLSVTAEEAASPDVYCITLVVEEDDTKLEQVAKQLFKLIDVEQVSVLSPRPTVERQLVLVKVRAPNGDRGRVAQEANIFNARVVHVGAATMTMELAGDPAQVKDFLKALESFGILEVVRSGKISLLKSDETSFAPRHHGERLVKP